MSAFITGYVEVRANGEDLTIPATGINGFGLEEDGSNSDEGSRSYGMLHKHFGDGFTLSISTTVVDSTVTYFSGVIIDDGDDVTIINDEISIEIKHSDEDEEEQDEVEEGVDENPDLEN
jgi:hypothetical protein